MPDITVPLAHSLDEDEALRRTRALLGRLRDRFGDDVQGMSEYWDGPNCTFTFRVKGVTISGSITVGPNLVTVRGSIPWLLGGLKGEIIQRIKQEGAKCLAAQQPA